MKPSDLAQASMLDLFRIEAESQLQAFTENLLVLEHAPKSAPHLETCMRAAHSLKGAARVVGAAAGVRLAHAMEDVLAAAQSRGPALDRTRIDILLRGIDLLQQIANSEAHELSSWDVERSGEIDDYLATLAGHASESASASTSENHGPPARSGAPSHPAGTPKFATQPQAAAPTHFGSSFVAASARPTAASEAQAPPISNEPNDDGARVLRVSPGSLNRLLGLAGESLVESRRLRPFTGALLRLKRQHSELRSALDRLREALESSGPTSGEHPARALLEDARSRTLECQQQLAQRLEEVESFEHRATSLSHDLYTSALACRMRPFADGLQTYPRMVRDLARSLGKDVHLEITGQFTRVDRDILEKLEAPLGHLLRNSVDHGIESAEERVAAGKPAHGTIRLSARHNAGRLHITVADDGRGIDLEKLRATVVSRNLSRADVAENLSETELLEFLLLPGFTMASQVTEISGRGVGLDVVQNVVREVHGSVRISSVRGHGTQFQLQVPLTLSVMRALLIDVSGEPYAVPLASITSTVKITPDAVSHLEGKPHFLRGSRRIALLNAHQILESPQPEGPRDELSVVVLGDQTAAYGLVVDSFLGERELVVQPLDPRLGKIKDIAAGSLMEDGSVVLILDVEDVLRSAERLASTGRLGRVDSHRPVTTVRMTRKRVLVIDDSLTVRELERKLLVSGGYDVEVAVDGMDGWNAIRAGHFDLVITDVDMPRLDGIELVRRLRKDPRTRALPVMIVSYKDRTEDRKRGLDAGADYYLAKAAFHDEALLAAVAELIGEAAA